MKPKSYDIIAIGTGSAMMIVDTLLRQNPEMKAAVIDKDDPGGICLTKGCIPTKILIHPANLVRTIESANKFGIEVEIKKVDFTKIMKRMQDSIHSEIEIIREGLSNTDRIDYYSGIAEFTGKYILKIGENQIKSDLILLCIGSKPLIPKIKGLNDIEYLTSDSVLKIKDLPKNLVIIGGSYIAAEFGHFFSSMGSNVTIIGRNPQFLHQEEKEVSYLAKLKMSDYMKIITNYEVIAVEKESNGNKSVIAVNGKNGERIQVIADEILLAVGRAANADILKPKKSGIKTDKHGNCRTIDANYYKGNSPSHIKKNKSLRTMAVLTPDRQNKRQNGRRIKNNGEPSFTLTAQDKHGRYDGIKIRRLTPIECERLQGFPDDWTKYGKIGGLFGVIDKKINPGDDAGLIEISDTRRYKCLGNAVTVNVVKEIMIKLLTNNL